MGTLMARTPEAGPLVVDTSEATPSYLWMGENGTHLKLSPSAYHLLSSVAAGTSFESIAASLSRRQGRPVPADEVAAAHGRLVEQIAAIEERNARPPPGFWLRLPCLPARLVAPLARALAPAFHPIAAPPLLLVVAVGCWLTLRQGLSLAYRLDEFWLGYLLFVLSLLAHELGHAAASARFGARPNEIGFAIYWLMPAFYSDVSAAWRLKRAQRVVVDLGGVYLQGLVGASFALAALVWEWAPLRVASLMILLSSLLLLSPILKFDGYWLLSDALGVANLNQQPGRILRHAAAWLRRRPRSPLPWPAWIVAALALYTLLSIGFWVVLGLRLAPLAWGQLLGYPVLLATVVGELLAPPHQPATRAVVALLTATYLLLMAALLLRRLGLSLARGTRALLARLGGQPPRLDPQPD